MVTRKIAIILDLPGSCYDCGGPELKITDWTEVSEEDYKALKEYQRAPNRSHDYSVIEQPLNTHEFIKTTVQDWVEYVKEEKKRIAAEELAVKQKALDRALKRQAKDRASKIELLAKLKKELGED